jgi:membrane protease YdiL (CAAX protease family)
LEKKIIIVAVSIFTLNDLVFVAITSPWLYFAFDYLCRIVVISMFVWAIMREKIPLQHLRLNKIDAKTFLVKTVELLIIGFILEKFGDKMLPSFGFLHFPEYPSVSLKIFDLSIGLLMVAFTEEFVFRGLLLNILQKHSVIISSVLFGFIHWGSGADSVIIATIIGAFFARTTIKTNLIYPALVAHFWINFFCFI